MFKTAMALIVGATAAAGADDLEARLSKMLGDSSSFNPPVFAVPMKDPMLEALELKFHQGKLNTAVLVFRRDVDRAAFKTASLKLIESKWAVKAPAAERNEDLVTIMPGGRGVQRSFLVDHWELEVELE